MPIFVKPKASPAGAPALDRGLAILEWMAYREALCFIDVEHMDERTDGDATPFCLQVAFQRPHHPLLPQKETWDMYPEDLDLPETINQDPSHRPPHFQKMWQAFHERTWGYSAPG